MYLPCTLLILNPVADLPNAAAVVLIKSKNEGDEDRRDKGLGDDALVERPGGEDAAHVDVCEEVQQEYLAEPARSVRVRQHGVGRTSDFGCLSRVLFYSRWARCGRRCMHAGARTFSCSSTPPNMAGYAMLQAKLMPVRT